jgi:topoisomerase IV subunit A
VTVVVSHKGWVRALKGHEVDVAGLQFKAGDSLYGCFACRSVDALAVLGSDGRVYSVAVAALPGGRGDGQPITSLIDLEPGTQPVHYHAGDAEQMLVLANSGGYGLLARVGDLMSRQRGGKTFLALEAGETPLVPSLVPAGELLAAQLGCVSANGRLLVFPLDELKHQPKGGRGLTLMGLEAKEALAGVAAFTNALRVQGSGRGGRLKDELLKGVALAAHVGKRARKGKAVAGIVKAQRVVAA